MYLTDMEVLLKTGTRLSPDEMLDRYQQLVAIEKLFRDTHELNHKYSDLSDKVLIYQLVVEFSYV